MEKDLRLLIGSINQTLKEINYTEYQLKIALANKKKGEVQNLKLKNSYLKKKILNLKDSLKRKLLGTIKVARFTFLREEQRETFEQTFVNLSEDEIKYILEVEALINSCNLEILEIKEIPTSIRKV